MKTKDQVLQDLKDKINENKDLNNNIDYKNKRDNEALVNAINLINKLSSENLGLKTQLQQEDNTISTTQFFNPSLAKDFYNMNGNSLQINSYLAVRQMLGIVNNPTPNVLQTIPGLNSSNTGHNPNGSAVGLTTTRKVQGWWLWTMILNRITYFQNLFKIECKNSKLLKAVHQYLLNLVLSGYAMIEKEDDNYYSYAITNIKLNEKGELESAQKYNSSFVINEVKTNDDKDIGVSDFKDGDNVVWGQWRSNGYNIWYYVMCYLLNSVDLLYICWNRSRLNKTIILQKKGNNSTASVEAMNFINPYQNVVTVNTVNTLDSENDSKIELENRYEVIDIGDGAQTQFSYTNFLNWTNWWDNEIGLRSASNGSSDGTRSITDEIQPDKLKLNKQQQDMLFNLKLFCEKIKEKFNEEVNIELEDIEAVKENPETKDEEGQEQEQTINNGKKQND